MSFLFRVLQAPPGAPKSKTGGSLIVENGYDKRAVTRIRTGVAAATTQSTNHYTITAHHSCCMHFLGLTERTN